MIKTILKLAWKGLAFALLATSIARAQYVTLTGTLQASNGLAASNYTISFAPSQWFYVAGTGVSVGTTTFCATSIDGSVVGLPNPLEASIVTPSYTGTLPAGNYYLKYTFYTSTTETLAGPESTVQLTANGTLTVAAPTSGIPAGATGMRVYISTASGSETLQGSTTGSGPYVQSVPLVSGASPPTTNTTICKEIANDAGWPTGTGYKVALTDPSGNTQPGYPMLWQLLGPNTTINLSSGLPYYHGVVIYPVPILASPQNNATQSIAGSLNFTGYNILNAGKIGVGTSAPAWSIDVENGLINSSQGYLYNGSAGTSGQCLVSNGTAFVPQACTNVGTIYYQAAFTNGTLVPQRLGMNFLTGLALSDNGVTTGVSIANTGVTVGSYTNPNIAVNAQGQITSASNGNAVPLFQQVQLTSGICTTGSAAYDSCGSAITWPIAFADTNYSVTCTTGIPNHPGLTGVWTQSKSTTGVQAWIQNGSASGAVALTVAEIDCTAVHP